MVYLLAVVLTAVVSIQAGMNPILTDKSYYNPSSIKVNGTYYVIASTPGHTSEGIFPIHTSSDLIEWKPAGYVFYGINIPAWAKNTTFHDPAIHQVGDNFLVYFVATSVNSSYYDIGVVSSSHPLGPYTSSEEPILTQNNEYLRYPSIIKDEDKLYLVWSSELAEILARQLNSNGLNFSSSETVSVLKPSTSWENEYAYAPWYLQRQNYHYLVYTGNGVCGKIGVARSSNALGPYEKLSTPILEPNNEYECPEEASLVKDLNDENYLVFFRVFNTELSLYSVVLASVGWDADWPKVADF